MEKDIISIDSNKAVLQIFTRGAGCPKKISCLSDCCCTLMQGLVQQLDLYAKLVGHEGCVNTVEFNSTGEVLVSGSDDKQVIVWDWASKRKIFAYPSGHLENIFQTKIMPFSDDRVIVTSAADGQVILALGEATRYLIFL